MTMWDLGCGSLSDQPERSKWSGHCSPDGMHGNASLGQHDLADR
jgi:hypothetical protein